MHSANLHGCFYFPLLEYVTIQSLVNYVGITFTIQYPEDHLRKPSSNLISDIKG